MEGGCKTLPYGTFLQGSWWVLHPHDPDHELCKRLT